MTIGANLSGTHQRRFLIRLDETYHPTFNRAKVRVQRLLLENILELKSDIYLNVICIAVLEILINAQNVLKRKQQRSQNRTHTIDEM